MTDMDTVKALEIARDYITPRDSYVGASVGEFIDSLKAEVALGDLKMVKRAYEAAEKDGGYFGEFNNAGVDFKKWLKAFYDAAVADANSREFKVGDQVKVISPAKTVRGGWCGLIVGDIGKIQSLEDTDGDVLFVNDEHDQWIDPALLILVESEARKPGVFKTPLDTPKDIKLKDSDGDIWEYVNYSWQFGGGLGRNWRSDQFEENGPYTEVIE